MLVLGVFVLTNAWEAWAAVQNTTVKRDVRTFMDEYGIQKGTGKLATQAAEEFEEKLKKINQKYTDAYLEVIDDCMTAWMDHLKADIKKKGGSCTGHAWKGLKNLLTLDFDDAAKEFNGSFDNCKSATGDALGFSGDFFANVFKTAFYLGRDNLVPRCKFTYKAHVEEARSLCRTVIGENKDIENRLDKMLEPGGLASKTQDAADSLCLLDGNNGEIFEHCVEDSKGKPVCTKFVIDLSDNIVTFLYGNITSLEGNTAGCQPLPFKVYEARSCLFCPMFTVIFNTIQSASTKAYNTLAKPLSTILLIGLAIWIALMVLNNVSAMTKQDAPKFLTDLFKNSFKVVIVFILLRYSSIIYDIIIGPLLKAGFEFGGSFLDHSSDLMKNCEIKASAIGGIGVLPNYIYTHLLCFIEAVQNELGVTQAIGSSLMCIARHKGAGDVNILALKQFLPDFSMLFQGFLVWIIAFIISIAFGFYLIDATVQLGIFGMVLPFLLMCYPFKITHGYFSTGVGVFVNSWFIFVFMGLVTNITLALIGQGATGGKGNMYDIETAINGNDITTLKNMLDIGFAGFVVLVACCVFAVKLMSKVQELAGTFGGGGLHLGIGNKIGGLAASGVTNTAKWVGGKVVKTGKAAVNARVFGNDGNEKSMADYGRAAKAKVGRGVGKLVQWAPKKVGKFVGTLAGRKRRNSSE